MAIRSDKNIEALRIGIAEQERKRLDREHIDAYMERLYKRTRVEADNVLFVPVIALLAGDRLVATDNGTDFRVSGIVRRIDRATEEGGKPAGDWWVTVDYAESESGSSYGHAFKSDQRVLVEGDSAATAQVRRDTIRVREEERPLPRRGGGCAGKSPVTVAVV